jgi:hypothetical protein
MAAIFNAPTKILPRVRSRGALRSVGANLLAYTQKPAVNLALLLVAGTLLVGMGFVLGSARREGQVLPAPAQPTGADLPAIRASATRTATPATNTPSTPVAAIAVSSLPVAPPKDQGSARTSPAASAHALPADVPLLPDRPPPSAEKTFVPPVRNPGF